jgi:hypothetical protein
MADDEGGLKKHDQLAKQILEALLEPLCRVKPQFEVTSAAQWIDVASEPMELDEATWDEAGFLGKMACLTCAFECYQAVLTLDEWHDCLSKRTLWQNHRVRQARRAKQTPPIMPFLWILCARPCQDLLDELGFGPCPGWPKGVYAGPTALMVSVVVIPELPKDKDTLFLRLLGRPAQRDEALQDTTSLAHDNPLFILGQSILDEIRQRQSLQWEPTMSTLIDRYRETIRQVRQEGRQEGLRAAVERLLARRFPEQASWSSLLDTVQAASWEAVLDDLLTANDAPAAVAILQRAAQA